MSTINKRTLKDVSDVMWRINFGDEKLTEFQKAKLCPKDVTLRSGIYEYLARFRGHTMCFMLCTDVLYNNLMNGYEQTHIVVCDDFIFYKEHRLSTDDVLNDYQLFNTRTMYDDEFTSVLEEVIKFEFKFDKVKTYWFNAIHVMRYIKGTENEKTT